MIELCHEIYNSPTPNPDCIIEALNLMQEQSIVMKAEMHNRQNCNSNKKGKDSRKQVNNLM